MLLLDTRNDYEVRMGAFKHAVDLNIKSFRAFPAAVQVCGLVLVLATGSQ